MTQDEATSPEEKLLRVIRSGRKPVEESETDDSEMKAPSPAVVPSGDFGMDREPAPAATGDAKTDGYGDDSPAPAASKPVFDPPALSPAGGAGDHPVIAGRALWIGALALVALAAWDVRGHFTDRRDTPDYPETARVGDSDMLDVSASAAVQALPSMETVLNRFQERPLFSLPSAPADPAPETAAPSPDAWERYVKANLGLLGLSVVDTETRLTEAILTDRKTGDLYYLTSGDTIVVEGKRITVDAVERDRAVLTDGARKVGVK